MVYSSRQAASREHETQTADIALKAKTEQYSVSGTAPEVFRTGTLSLYASGENGYEYRLPNRVAFEKNGSFTFSRVPPGVYNIEGRALAGNDEYLAEERVRVDAGDVRNISVAAAKAGTLRILLTSSEASAVSRAAPMLEEVRTGHRAEIAPVGDGGFLASEVRPGDYAVSIEEADTLCVDTVSIDGREAMLPLRLREISEGEQVSVRLTDRCGSVAGVLAAGINGRLLLTTEDLTVLGIGHAGKSGQFLITGLPLGRYRLFAWPSLDGVPYRDPGYLKGLEDKSVALDLTEQSGKTGVAVPFAQ